ncbi:unnamed protein product [Lampetra fluviatilis]
MVFRFAPDFDISACTEATSNTSCYISFPALVHARLAPYNRLNRFCLVLPSSRCVLVSWLIPVRRHLSLSLHSLSLALSLLDRFLARVPLASDCLQLLGVACLHIAAKQVEVTAPRASQLLDLCGRAFTTQQLKNLERLVLLRLKFRLLAPTAADFLSFYLSRERGEAARGRALGEAEMEASLSPPPSPLPLASSSVAASSISKLPPSTAAPTTLSPPPSPQLLPQTPSTERGCTLSPPTSQQPPPLPPHPSSATTKGSVVRCFLAYNYDSNPNRYPYPNHTTPTNHNSTTTSTTTEKSSLSPVCSFSALSCLSEQILELSFADYAFNAFPASTLALAALEVASRLLGWSGTNDGDTRRKKLPLKLSRALWLDCVGRLCLLVSLNQNILPTPHELGLAGTSRFYDLDM